MGKLQEMLKVGPVFNPASTNLKMMHGINKISIVLFLIAVIVMIFRAITRV
jgi:hypothetical protein